MSIAEKIGIIAENVPVVYSAGKSEGMREEHGTFWDTFQENGARTNYDYAFYGYGWRTENFKPKYPIRASRCTRMFFNSMLTNLADYTLDTSECDAFTDMFNNAWGVSHVPRLDMRKLSDASNAVYTFSSPNISKIECLVISESTRFAQQTFYGTSALEELRLEGTLACNMDLHWSRKLSADSIINVVGTLSGTASGLTLTLPSEAEQTVDAKRSGLWAELIASKPNWTVSLI